MKLQFTFVLLLAILPDSTQLMAQGKLSIDNVYTVKLRNSGTITEGDEIKGYFLFYQSDKIDKKTNEYTLKILDGNLNTAKDIRFNDSKNIVLLEAAYNNQGIMFSFIDTEEKILSYKLYDFNGKQSQLYTKIADDGILELLKKQLHYNNSDAGENKTLFDIKNKGFISLIRVKNGVIKQSFELSFYGSSQRKQWTYVPVDDAPISIPQFIGVNGNIVFIQVIKNLSTMATKTKPFILAIDLNTGKKLFESATVSDEMLLLPADIISDGNEKSTILSGPCFPASGDVLKTKPDGIAFWNVNEKGNLTVKKKLGWEGEFAKLTPVKTKEKNDALFVHKFIKTDEGEIFIVAEGYEVSSLSSKVKIRDMFLISLKDDYSVNKLEVFEKEYNNVSVPFGSFLSNYTKAYIASLFPNGYDFCYLQSNESKSFFSAGYTNYDRNKGSETFGFSLITYQNGGITTDKITLKSNATSMVLFPAKLGSVMIIEYFKKEKRLELRLEKVN